MKCVLIQNNEWKGLINYTTDLLQKERQYPNTNIWLLPDSFVIPVRNETALAPIDPRPFPNDVALEAIRIKRDLLLAETDWVTCSDVSLSTSKKNEYIAYRQELRDLPQTFANNPNDVVWPEKP